MFFALGNFFNTQNLAYQPKAPQRGLPKKSTFSSQGSYLILSSYSQAFILLSDQSFTSYEESRQLYAPVQAVQLLYQVIGKPQLFEIPGNIVQTRNLFDEISGKGESGQIFHRREVDHFVNIVGGEGEPFALGELIQSCGLQFLDGGRLETEFDLDCVHVGLAGMLYVPVLQGLRQTNEFRHVNKRIKGSPFQFIKGQLYQSAQEKLSVSLFLPRPSLPLLFETYFFFSSESFNLQQLQDIQMYGPDSYVKRSIVDSRATALGVEPYRDYYPNRPASPRENIRQINVPEREVDVATIKEADRVRVERERSYQGLVDRVNILEHENNRLVQQVGAWNDRVNQLAHFKNQELSVNDQLHQNELQNYRRHNFSQIQAMADQINMLKDRIVSSERQVDDLKVSNEHLENDRRILQETDLRLKDLEMKTAAMLSQLNARNVDCDKLAMRASQLDTRLAENEDQNDQIRNLIDGKTRENGALQAKIGQCQVDMANLRNEQTLDKQNQGRLLAQIHQLDLKIAHQEGEIDELKNVNQGEYNKYNDYAQRLKAQYLDRESEAADSREKNTTLLDNLNAMKLREYELREEVAVLRQRFDIYNAEKEHHVQALQDQITVLRNQIGLKERELLNTSEKINRAQNKIDQLLAENNELLNAIEQIKRDIDDLEHAHIQDLQNRDARHRQDLDIMDRNFNDTVDSYIHQIQDLKNLVEKKEADILALKKEYLNQAQQNETLMRREEGIIDQINQVKIRVEEIQRQKELQLAGRDQKQRNQLDTIRKVHTAELQNIRAQNNELEFLLRDRMEENERLKAEGRNLVDNLQAVKSSESRLFSENQQFKNKAVQLQFFKNKEVAGHEDLRRSHTIANSKQHQTEIQALQNTLLQLRMKCDAKAKESEQWRRNFYNVRQGRPYAN